MLNISRLTIDKVTAINLWRAIENFLHVLAFVYMLACCTEVRVAIWLFRRSGEATCGISEH